MATSATEQPDAAMHFTLDVQSEVYANILATPVANMKWEIHVEFNNCMWWAMPHGLSDQILDKWAKVLVTHVWDWGDTRSGSHRQNGAATTFHRYMIGFTTTQQRNLDNERSRMVKVVCFLR